MSTRAFYLGLFTCLVVAAAAQPSPSPSPARVASPVIDDDRRVTFRLQAPQADEVTVAGEFMAGRLPLVKGDDGLWSVTVGPIDPEIYYYNFTVDGVRTIDPGNPQVKTGSTFSTIASVLEVKGDDPEFYDGQPVPHGTIRTHWYESKSLGSLRRLTVYTPPGYDSASEFKLAVLYLLHGANADETAWTRLGRVNLILDNLIAAGKTKPFLVVMPFGYGIPPDSPEGRNQNTARFGDDLINDVIPYVDSNYRTAADRDHRALVGLSMGGGQSLTIGLNHLELFSYVGGFSAALRGADEFSTAFASLIADPAATNEKLRLLWIGCGTDDRLFDRAKAFSAFLSQHGIEHVFRDTAGAHTWMVWRRYLNEIAPLLF